MSGRRNWPTYLVGSHTSYFGVSWSYFLFKWMNSLITLSFNWFKFLLELMYIGMVAAGALFTRAFELRQASAGAFTPQERTPLVGDDGAQLPSAPVDPSAMQVDETNDNERVPENSLCTVCLDAPKDSFFDPCGHRCTCYSCGMRSVSSTHLLSIQ